MSGWSKARARRLRSYVKVPDVVVGTPPLEAGNLRGVTVDVQRQVNDYLEAAGWDPWTCRPRRSKLEKLGLDFVARDLASVG
ncbi:MAG: hypothetical protein JO057_02705 [Chloroflexi bacterium]|nr:hypothetical protein [Chloroflexota bacterium]